MTQAYTQKKKKKKEKRNIAFYLLLCRLTASSQMFISSICKGPTNVESTIFKSFHLSWVYTLQLRLYYIHRYAYIRTTYYGGVPADEFLSNYMHLKLMNSWFDIILKYF